MAPNKPPPRPSSSHPPSHPPTPPQSTREQMKDAVGKVMQQVADQKQAVSAEARAEIARKRARQQRAIVLTVLSAIVFVVSLVLAIPRWRTPFPVPTGAAAERDARNAIVFAASVVERYQLQRGRLPIALEETGVVLPGVIYAVRGDRYELTVLVDNRPIRFTSGDDLTAFRTGRP